MMPSKQFSQSEKCNCIFQLIKPKHNKAFILPLPPSHSSPPSHSLHFKRSIVKTQVSVKCKINILLSFLKTFFGQRPERNLSTHKARITGLQFKAFINSDCPSFSENLRLVYSEGLFTLLPLLCSVFHGRTWKL